MIYILDDENNTCEFVLYALSRAGYKAEGFSHPQDFWNALGQRVPSLLLLDVMLPGEDGLQILDQLRKRSDTQNMPVIMLTAKSTEYDKVIALDKGADDYIVKPFGTMELISRIRALLRRTKAAKNQEEYVCGNLYMCPVKHLVLVNKENVVLTLKEFEILLLMMKNYGRVYTREELLSEVWGYTFGNESRTVDVHMRTLRAKLGDCGKYIETIRGVGYRFNAGGDTVQPC
ncbi:MAG: response regulator transcription factor [Ruminococcus sp.]|nr:response regulator transcription factor [Ruminococcus sp.]